MKPNPLFFLVVCVAVLGIVLLQPPSRATAQSETATPTYDPLVEPPLPPNPTELELGQNLYWHWCMTCHGDRGQGLTDEFREIWEEDHQNCWAKGCHAGRPGDTGFPIPTFVPGVVDDNHLAQFTSLQAFADFLKTTHPPQSPGILKDEEYQAIALFVFTMNGREVDATNSDIIPTLASSVVKTSLPVVTATSFSIAKPASNPLPVPYGILVVVLLGCLGIVILFWTKRISSSED